MDLDDVCMATKLHLIAINVAILILYYVVLLSS